MKKLKPWQIVLLVVFCPFSIAYFILKWLFKKNAKSKKGTRYDQWNPQYSQSNNNGVSVSEIKLLHPNGEFVQTPRGIVLNKNNISTNLNLSNIIEFQSGYYLISSCDFETVSNDILSLNSLLYIAHKKCVNFPLRKICREHLHFEKRVINGRNTFCFISFEPNTPSGKEAKYPICLHLNVSHRFFGDLYYLQNGTIGKAKIIAWTNNDCYELSLLVMDGVLSVNNIYLHDLLSAKKEKLYSAKQKGEPVC